MALEPKIIQVPGIPGNLQEQTLDQYLSILAPDHLARKQLDEIRNQALKSVELSTQLMQANEKVIELQKELLTAIQSVPPSRVPVIPSMLPPPYVVNVDPPPNTTVALEEIAVTPPDPRSGPFPKVECPHCKKLVSTSPAGWAAHQRNTHPDNQAPRPKC